MKVLILGDGGSAHIQKWVRSLSEKNIEVGLFSLHHFDIELYKDIHSISILNNPSQKNARSILSKLAYLTNGSLLKKQLDMFKPDILHAHYASSYGLLGAKMNFKPFVVSAWGSDVFDFPKTSVLHKKIIKKVLSSANVICSTSHCMKEETLKYTTQKIEVVPFGVDTDLFKPEGNGFSEKKEITIGIIKSLEKKYGIEYLLHAFNDVLRLYTQKKLRLLIVGDGSKRSEYQHLCAKLGISDKVTFTGKVKHSEIINYHKQIDIFVSLSVLDSESFGVSLVEAMSCGKPVVASNAAGFKEVVGNDTCGVIVPKNSHKEAAFAIQGYLLDPQKAMEKGGNARRRVLENYDWKKNLEQMLTIYQGLK